MKRSLLIFISLLMISSAGFAWEAGEIVYNNLHNGRTQILKVVDRKRDMYQVKILEGDYRGKVMEMIGGVNFQSLSHQGQYGQVVRARGNSLSSCSETLYANLGIFESDAQRACQYGRDSQFLTCTVNLARSMGEQYVAAAGYFCSHKSLNMDSLECAATLYLRGGQAGDHAVSLCQSGVNRQLNNCILDMFNNKGRSADAAREICKSQYDFAVIAARQRAEAEQRARQEAQRRAALEQQRAREEARLSQQRAIEAQRQAVAEARKEQDRQRKELEELARKQQAEMNKVYGQQQQQATSAATTKQSDIEAQRKIVADALNNPNVVVERITIKQPNAPQTTASTATQKPVVQKTETVKVVDKVQKIQTVKTETPKTETTKTDKPVNKKPVLQPVPQGDLPPLPVDGPATGNNSQNSQSADSTVGGDEEGILIDLPLE